MPKVGNRSIADTMIRTWLETALTLFNIQGSLISQSVLDYEIPLAVSHTVAYRKIWGVQSAQNIDLFIHIDLNGYTK